MPMEEEGQFVGSRTGAMLRRLGLSDLAADWKRARGLLHAF
jgi:hypothetical protein